MKHSKDERIVAGFIIPQAIQKELREFLIGILYEYTRPQPRDKKPIVSSEDLSNRYMEKKWSIRISQLDKYFPLFKAIREETMTLFKDLLATGSFLCPHDDAEYQYEVSKIVEVGRNLVLHFKKVS